MAVQKIYPGGVQTSTPPLTGAEYVDIDAGGAVTLRTTTAAIGGLSGGGATTDYVSTSITTVGNGTLTAAALLGGIVVRTGPVAAYTDTTDTAANILTSIGTFVSGATIAFIIKNATAFPQTIAGGTGVTAPTTNIIGPFQEGEYFGTIGGTAAAPTIVLSHIQTGAISSVPSSVTPQIATLATNGAGTLTAAAITGGLINRTTVAAPFTDTTDTAANIIAANPGLLGKIGASFIFIYSNNSTGLATIAGGTGVTVSGVTNIPFGMSAEFLITYTAAATLTMVGLGVTNAASTLLPVAGASSGQTNIQATAVAAGTLTLPAVTGTVASTTGTNLFVVDTKRTSASVTVNGSAAYVNVTGLSYTVVPGTYIFDIYLPSTVASGTAGIKYAFNYTTAVLSVLQATGSGSTSAATAVQQTQTTTTQTDIFTQAAVVLLTRIFGTMVVTTGGTVDVQVSQNTSNASNTVALIGGYATFIRIA